jgi:hypothetical protein
MLLPAAGRPGPHLPTPSSEPERDWEHRPQVQVEPITTRECARPARRPANSRLDCSKLERTFGIRLPPWQQGVEECIDELARAEAALLA